MEGSSKVIRRNNRKYLALGASLLCSMNDVCICLWFKVYGINYGSNLAPTTMRGCFLAHCILHETSLFTRLRRKQIVTIGTAPQPLSDYIILLSANNICLQLNDASSLVPYRPKDTFSPYYQNARLTS